LDVELGALVEDTNTVGTGASTDQVAEGAAEDAGVDVGGVTSVGGLVAARELSLVTTLGLGLLDGHSIGNLEAGTLVALDRVVQGLSRGSGGEASQGEDDSGDSELHCAGRGTKD
jgi:hypothetical protein